jgi:hypothetical protein
MLAQVAVERGGAGLGGADDEEVRKQGLPIQRTSRRPACGW